MVLEQATENKSSYLSFLDHLIEEEVAQKEKVAQFSRPKMAQF
jgi:hypothetical protein